MRIISIISLVSIVITAGPALPIAWGFATSAYQIEGAWNVSGKGISVWDKWFLNGHKILAEIKGHTPAAGSPFIATDHYDNMVSDIAILGQLKATAYRFSISWPRIFPNCSGTVNQAGIQFYSNMIDQILKNGAIPILTMFHWDTPQACHDQYQSWSDRRIIADFTAYADVLFQNFGDRVSQYLTINEPAAFCGRAYGVIPASDQWIWPPAMNASEQMKYTCSHLVNLAHASVVNMARTKYPTKNFKFGLPLIIEYGIPLDPNNAADVELAKMTTVAQADWFWGPMFGGDYPSYLRQISGGDSTYNYFNGPLLPVFTAGEQKSMKGTIDFLGVNYYSASYRSANGTAGPVLPVSGTSWQNLYPEGIRDITKLLSTYYGGMDVMVTECGISVPNESEMTLDQRVHDTFRQNFFTAITTALSDAVLVDKTPIKAFLAWSLLDNLEWLTFDQKFGLVVVDQINGTLKRTVKDSANALASFFSSSKSPYTLPAPSSGGQSVAGIPGGSGKSGSVVDGAINAVILGLVSSLSWL